MQIDDYIKNFSFDLWNKKATFCINKINKLKKDKSKIDYINEIYALYIQLIENFIIFLLVRWTKNTIFLFKSSYEIQKQFNESKKDLFEWLIKEIFIWVPKDKYISFRSRYLQLLNEIIKDYTNDKDFLNSYKHWYRIKWNFFNSTLAIRPTWSTGDFIKLASSPHSISYLWLREDKKNKIKYIDEHSISFDSNYIYWKIIFITDLIDKIKYLYKRWWKFQLNYLTLDNTWYLQKKNSFRFCQKNKYYIEK